MIGIQKGMRTGFTVSHSVVIDPEGFENIDEFWSLENVSSNTKRSSSTTTKSRGSTQSNDDDDDDNWDFQKFNLDTSDTITEDSTEASRHDNNDDFDNDEEDTADEKDIINTSAQDNSFIKRRPSSTRPSFASVSSSNSTLPLEDSVLTMMNDESLLSNTSTHKDDDDDSDGNAVQNKIASTAGIPFSTVTGRESVKSSSSPSRQKQQSNDTNLSNQKRYGKTVAITESHSPYVNKKNSNSSSAAAAVVVVPVTEKPSTIGSNEAFNKMITTSNNNSNDNTNSPNTMKLKTPLTASSSSSSSMSYDHSPPINFVSAIKPRNDDDDDEYEHDISGGDYDGGGGGDDENFNINDENDIGGDENIDFNDDNDNNNDYDDHNDDDDDDDNETTNINKSNTKRKSNEQKQRRVSFGADTKDNTHSNVNQSSSSSSSSNPSLMTPVTTPMTKSKKKTASAAASTASDSSTLDISLNTPESQLNSKEFTRGRALPDDSFHNNGITSDDDDDNDDRGNNKKKGRGRKQIDDDESNDDDDDELVDTDNETDKSGFTADYSFLASNKKRKQHQREEDDYGDNPQEKEEEGTKMVQDETGHIVRKSTRAYKGERFAFWKNERIIYHQGGKIVGVQKAKPTPKKPTHRKRTHLSRLNGVKGNKSSSFSSIKKKSSSSSSHDTDQENDDEEEDENNNNIDHSIPQFKNTSKYEFRNRDNNDMLIWDEYTEQILPLPVFCSKKSLSPPSALPITATRRVNNRKVGVAAQYFNMNEIPGLASGWIAGYVELPGGAIKDEEIVGEYVQVFFVSDCENGMVELGLSDPTLDEWDDKKAQRILLKKGDSFFVPPANIYRLENHGKKPCFIFWTIIKPVITDTAATEEAGDEVDDMEATELPLDSSAADENEDEDE